MDYYLISTNRMLIESAFVQKWRTHLLLAQFLYDHFEAREAAKNLCATKQVILDNGAYEEVKCDPFLYSQLAAYLQPWCVVLPDEYGATAQSSRAISTAFIARMSTTAYNGKYMYVPQGRSKEEVLSEFAWAFAQDVPWIVGLGKCYLLWGTDEQARFQFLQEVEMLPNAETKQLHMLGARGTAVQNYGSLLGIYENVIGIDTFKPTRKAAAADHGLNYKIDQTYEGAVSDWWLESEVHRFCSAYGIGAPK